MPVETQRNQQQRPKNRTSRDRQSMPRNKLATGMGWFSIGLGLAEVMAPAQVARLIGTKKHNTLMRLFGLREIAAGIGILTTPRPVGWMWARVAGDALDLSALASAAANERV